MKRAAEIGVVRCTVVGLLEVWWFIVVLVPSLSHLAARCSTLARIEKRSNDEPTAVPS